MTTGELLDQSSSVTGVSALTHLQNLNAGGGNIFNVIGENTIIEEMALDQVEDTGSDVIDIIDDTSVIDIIESDIIEEVSDKDEIIEIEEGVIDGTC